MAVCDERVVPAAHATGSLAATSQATGGALALALAAGALYTVHLGAPAFFDNEARYAEVAREMVVGHDWLTPHLDFTLFLNKPPLVFWLAALVFRMSGPTEWARLVSVVAAVVALFATCRLGTLLYGTAAGLVAGVMLGTSLGFVLEARTLRPDMVLTAAVCVALLCWQRAEVPGTRRTPWLAGLYAALAVGMLAKGLVPVVIAALPIAAVMLHDVGWRGVAWLHPGLGVVVIALIALPWHVATALQHPGFAWDYVVNQHLLFFFDRKLPRDSGGDSLAFFWGAFAGRAIPWVLLLPLTLREAVHGLSRGAPPAARATFFVWTWVAGVLLFFSCAPSRLEHYSIPALPAAALLGARAWQQAREGAIGRPGWVLLAVVGALIALAGATGVASGPELLSRTYWIDQAPALRALAVPAGATLIPIGVLVGVAALRRRASLLVATLALGMVPLTVIVLRAEVEAEPLFSWRPTAHLLLGAVEPATEIVYEAPEEYQLVAGLAYYTGQRITLLAPPGFVPPTYLEGQMTRMFLPRAELESRWRAGERLAFVSDEERRREDPADLVPPPYRVLGRFGDRWVLATTAACVAR